MGLRAVDGVGTKGLENRDGGGAGMGSTGKGRRRSGFDGEENKGLRKRKWIALRRVVGNIDCGYRGAGMRRCMVQTT